MLTTFEVSKLDKSKEVKFEHPQNILTIYVTFEISKLDIFKEVNDEQP